MSAPRTRAEAARVIAAYARERLADIGDTEVSVSTSRGARVAATGGPSVLYLTVEIQIDAPDAESTL